MSLSSKRELIDQICSVEHEYFFLFIVSESLQKVSINIFHTEVIPNKNSQTQMN